MSYPTNGRCPKCSPGTQDRVSAGDDSRAREDAILAANQRAAKELPDPMSPDWHCGCESDPYPKPVSSGDDGRARLEKDLGLDIDPKTGRAYESQGDFHNLGLGTGGRFYNGAAVPRTARCHNCEGFVTEAFWGQGFENCGGVDIGGQWFLCPECIKKVLAVLPRVRALVAAHNGGDLKRRG